MARAISAAIARDAGLTQRGLLERFPAKRADTSMTSKLEGNWAQPIEAAEAGQITPMA
jgi:hypothetical protein